AAVGEARGEGGAGDLLPRQGGPVRRAGFTVVEVLMGVALLAALLASFSLGLFGGGRSYARARAKLDLVSSCRAVLARIDSDVRRAVSKVQVSDAGTELILRVLDPS